MQDNADVVRLICDMADKGPESLASFWRVWARDLMDAGFDANETADEHLTVGVAHSIALVGPRMTITSLRERANKLEQALHH